MLKQIKAPFDLNWLQENHLQSLLSILSKNGQEARIVGGAVRNALLGKKISDIDIATTYTPELTIKQAQKAGFKTIATGLKHGTITVIIDDKVFEVTSLRQDKKTYGRHADVEFTNNWEVDAKRRDFSINALYLSANGIIFDYAGGLEDIKLKLIRFIGDADKRIAEDYLRILRFFRFYAYYGEGAPDREALLSCSKHKYKLEQISAERIWKELKQIFIAPNPLRALLWMRKTEILDLLIPQSSKWGIDLFPLLLKAEQTYRWPIEESPLLRLQAIIPPRIEATKTLADKLKLSNKDTINLANWCKVENLSPDLKLHKSLFLYGREALIAALKLKIAATNSEIYLDLLNQARTSPIPIFPLQGKDLLQQNYAPGKELGLMLDKLKNIWLESDCSLSKEELKAYL